jgi:hypothetical protein
MAQIEIKNLNLGGLSDSDYMGAEGSVAEMVNCDIHSEPGIIKANQALTKDSGATVTELILAPVSCSNGSTYHFGDAGGIYEREADGTWTKRATAAPAAGAAKILSAAEYQGYLYYSMQSRLGRIAVPSAGGSWDGRNDSWATFTNTDADFHPMKEVSMVLYIGDKNYIAQVDGVTFSANALDIKNPLRISSLWNLDTDLLIGTYVAANVLRTEIIRWNTWSVSYSVSDPIPEAGINAFLDADNQIIVNAGQKGNLYIYDGAQLDIYKKIKGTWNSTNKAVIKTNCAYNFGGMPLFGLSQVTGTGVNLGIYSLARTNRNYPFVLNLEYKISANKLTGIEIGTICPVSSDQFLVSWKDGATYGVDILNLTIKATAYFISRNMMVDRVNGDNYGFVHVPYRSLPANTSIDIFTSVNHAAFDAEATSTVDTEHLIVSTDAHLGNAAVAKVKIVLNPNANNAPEVEMAIIPIN